MRKVILKTHRLPSVTRGFTVVYLAFDSGKVFDTKN